VESDGEIRRKQLIRVAMVLVAGLFAGIAAALVLANIRPVVYGRRGLESLTGLPVLGVVRRPRTTAARTSARLDVAAFLLAGIALLAAHAAAAYWEATGMAKQFFEQSEMPQRFGK
jgi:hypothetical protein